MLRSAATNLSESTFKKVEAENRYIDKLLKPSKPFPEYSNTSILGAHSVQIGTVNKTNAFSNELSLTLRFYLARKTFS